MAVPNISKDIFGRIVVSFTYDPLLVLKIKAIEGHRWHPVEKHWSFPNKDSILEKILKVFGDKEVQIDPALQANSPTLKGTVSDLQTTYPCPPHRWGRSPTLHSFGDGAEGEGVQKLESGLSPKYDFEDLRRELVSKKYN